MTTAELSRGKRMTFTAILVVLVAVGLEAVAQAVYYATAGDFLFRRVFPPIYTADPVRCYRLQADADYVHRTNEFSARYITNAQGFRTDEGRPAYAYEKPASVYRVLFLGPSYTFGWGNDYADIYPTLIGQRLRVPGKRVEVINAGTPGQGPGQQLCWLEKEGYRYHPDLIVQAVIQGTLGGVLGECPRQLNCPVVKDARLYTTYPSLLKRISGTVNVSALVLFGYYAYHSLFDPAPRRVVEPGKELWDEGSRKHGALDLPALTGEYARYLDFVRRVVGTHTRVAFLHVPVTFVVHPADAPRWGHMYPGPVDPDAIRARIRVEAEALRRRGTTVIDPIDGLTRAGRHERMFYWLDIHMTPAGNRVIADEAAPTLQGLATAGAVTPHPFRTAK